jgi:RNA polymerase sigma-70 factor (ECF subfamily)
VDGAEKKEASEKVWLALRQLPTEQAEVVVLKIWEELTFQEISWTLEIPMPTAASRYRYAIAKLSEILGHQIEDLSESLAGEPSHLSSSLLSNWREEV